MKGVEVLDFTGLDSLSCAVLVKLPDLVTDVTTMRAESGER